MRRAFPPVHADRAVTQCPLQVMLCVLLWAATLCGCSFVRQVRHAQDIVALPAEFSRQAGEREAALVCREPEIPALHALVSRLDEGNFEVAQAAARIGQAEAAARSAFAARWPALSASLSAERAKSFVAGFNIPEDIFGEQGPRTQYRASLAAQWEIDLWGKLTARGRAAALSLDAARAQREALLISLSAELADALATRLGQHAITELLRAQENISQRFLQLTEVRFGQGLAPGVDIVRQRQQLEALRGELALADAREAATQARLDVLLGVARGDSLPSPLPELPAPAAIPIAGLPADVIARRPDIASAYLQLAAADELTAAAVAARLPSIRLSGSVFDISDDFAQLFETVLWQVTGELALVLFDAGQLAAAAEEAESRAEELLYRYAQTVVQAVNEVQAALASNAAQDALAESLERQISAARRALELERQLYVGGDRDFLAVLTAIQSLQQAERQLADARIAQFGSRIELCRALGFAVGTDLREAEVPWTGGD